MPAAGPPYLRAVLLIAHVGHWAVWILYAVPIAIVLASILISVRRERRQRRAEPSIEDAASDAVRHVHH
jgi:cytochrome c-type biogenesis protein CcmH/NrfF